jgi:hypothetical protein
MKRLLLSIALTTMLLLAQKPASASYFTAMDMSLIYMGGNDYQVRFVMYRDCNYINAPATVPIHFQCATNSSLNFSTNIGTVPGTGQEVPQVCAGMPTNCSGGSLIGFQEYVYQGLVQLPPCGQWVAKYTNCCRNPSNTLNSATSTSAYIEVFLDNLNAPGSSSPVMTTMPVLVLTKGQPNCQNPGAVDLDGDSLSYALVTPFNSSNTTFVNFQLPYSATNPLNSSPPVTMDAITGELCMYPTMNMVAVLAIRVQKWRKINGVQTLIGRIYRDMQFTVITMTNNLPKMSGIDSTLTAGYDINNTQFLKEVCAGSNVSFAVWGKDPDIYNAAASGSPETFSISWNQGIQSGSFNAFNQNTDSAHAVFTWSPTGNDIREAPYCFIVTIRDNACPYYGIRHHSYCLKVKGIAVDIGPDMVVCSGTSVLLQAQTAFQPALFLWRLDGLLMNVPQPGNQFQINAGDLISGVRTVSVEVNNGTLTLPCPGIDEMQIVILPLPQPMLGNDTTIGLNSNIVLDAGAGFSSYLWSTGASTQFISIDSSGTGQGTGTYWVKVTDNSGCEGADTIQVTFYSNPGIDDPTHQPALTLSPNPSNGKLELNLNQFLPGTVIIEVVDFDGKTIYEAHHNLTGNQEKIGLDIRNVAAGMYLLRVKNKNTAIVAKLVIQKD